MGTFNLSDSQVRFILSCVEDRRDILLRKSDNLRKMKGSIDDELYNFFMDSHQSELHLLHDTSLILRD